MNFDGRLPGTKKRVALGGAGNAAPESRDALLARARAEREARARASREATAATRVQAAWRGWSGRASARAGVRARWVEAYGPQGQRVDSASLGPASTLLRDLAFFARPETDAVALATALGAAVATARIGKKNASDLGLTRPAGAALARAAVHALWAHRAAWAADLASPRGSGPSPAAALADFLAWVADPAGAWGGDGAAAAAVLAAAVRPLPAGGGALFDRAGGLLPEAVVGDGVITVGAGLVGNAAARAFAAGRAGGGGPGAAAAAALPRALAAAPNLWARCPPLAPLAARLARAACDALITSGGSDTLLPTVATVAAWVAPVAGGEAAPPGGAGGCAAALLGNLSAAAPALASTPAGAVALASAGAALLAACPPRACGLGEAVVFDCGSGGGGSGAGGGPRPSSSSASSSSSSDDDDDDGGAMAVDGPSKPPSSSTTKPWLAWVGPPSPAVEAATAAQAAALAGPAVLGPLVRNGLGGGSGPRPPAAGATTTAVPAFLAALTARKGPRPRALAVLAATGAAPALWRGVVRPAAVAGRVGVGMGGGGATAAGGGQAPPPPPPPAAVARLLPALAVLAPTLSTSLAATPDGPGGLGAAALGGLDPDADLVGSGEGGIAPALLPVCTAALAHLLWSGAPPSSADALPPSSSSPSSSLRAAAIDGVAALLRALHDRARPDGSGPSLPPASFVAPPGALPPPRFQAEVRAGPGGRPTPRSAAVLRLAPFLVPFHDRVAAFTDALADDFGGGGGEDEEWGWGGWGGFGGGGAPPARPRFAVVRRTAVLADALAALAPLPPRTLATGRIRIQFIDEHGLDEAGIDGGGLWKECANLLVRAAFSPKNDEGDGGGGGGGPDGDGGGGAGLFAETPGRELYPDPAAVAAAVAASSAAGRRDPSFAAASGGAPPAVVSLETYEFLGRLLGRLARDGLASGVPLAPFVVKQLLRRPVGLADLPSLDPALAASLAALRSAPPSDVDGAGLTFTASDASGGEVPLHPGGAARAVTGDNVVEFVVRAAHHYLTARLAPALAALRRGLEATLPPGWAAAFGAAEFAALLGGAGPSPSCSSTSSASVPPLDVEDMRAHARYGGGYAADHPAVAAFWEALGSMTPPEQASVLRFVTAAGRPPLLGFGRLAPPLTIVPGGGGEGGEGGGESRLPTAATCLNLLKLPAYGGGAAEVKAKLLYAAAEAGGFGLS